MSTSERVISYLESRGFKKLGGEWRGNSPLRPGSDSGAFTLKIDAPEDGVWHDHVSGESGRLYELCDRLGIERPTGPTPVENTKRAYKDLADYAKAHGVDADVFTDAKWEQVTEDGRPAIRFPTAHGVRYRFLDGNKPPYKSPVDYTSCWYGLMRALKMTTEKAAPLVLVNGEASVVVCQHYGIPAAAVTSGGERALSPELLKELKDAYAGRVLIAFDCDDAGRKGAADLAEQLKSYAVAVIDFGLDTHGDAADWCALYRDAALPKMIERAEWRMPVKTTARASDLLAESDERKRLIVTGQARLWLPTGFAEWDAQLGGGMWMGSNYIGGGQKMGKSTLCNSVAGNWIGQGMRGYIITTEMAADMWLDRTLAAMARVPSIDIMLGNVGPAGKLAYLEARRKLAAVDPYFCTKPVPSVADVREEVLDLAASKAIEFVVIDSASNMYAPGVSGDLFSQMKAITNQINTLAMEAHKARGGTEPMPFVITAQGNMNEVRRRDAKIITALDIYGGQTAGQDASTLTTVNWFHWYVMKHLTDPNPEWPKEVAALNVDAVRYGAGGDGKLIRMRFVPGMGFYDDNVPVGHKPEPKRSNVVPMPRAYKDHDELDRVSDIEF